ncbi:B-lymphocyte antigen CD19 [Eublepharis macularius]|uniref:B-lymphocyte antigen CD19 n=1 Tax=Eublepharis macularius TaxID=481883 RepID=A0AA97K6Y7_EUBMA|nr:B-lymphocyte antigen CD19 [Eublepharis macularius]
MEQNGTDSSYEYQNVMDSAQFPVLCNGSETSNWTRKSLSWILPNRTKAELNMQIWRIVPYWLQVDPDSISLLLPSVTSRDAGNYTCHWKNQSQHFQLEVSAKSGTPQAVWQHFGKQHWIIWSVALGYLAACLGSLFCFLRFKRAFHARREKKQLREPARRKFFHAQRNKAPGPDGILLPAMNGDGKEQMDAFSYENILPNMSSRGGQQSLQKANTLPAAGKMEDDDDEEYEHPDSEIEQKSDDEDNYENAQEEVKQEDVVSNDGSSYENSKKERCGSDGDNYENVEEEIVLSPGAARLIAGLRLQLALDPQVDKQDGGSEASTGSQSYEEMNGTLSPTTSKGLQTSNEEDGDSYENMESPNSFSLRKEGNVDPGGEGVAFGSVRQNLSISFGADLKGAL